MLKIIPLALILSSCCGIPNQGNLNLPPKLHYPSIKAEELSCLSDKTYDLLNERRAMCESRVKTLTNIIKSTH